MLQVLAIAAVLLILFEISFSIAAYRLSRLAGKPVSWQSIIPGANAYVVYECVGLEKREAAVMLLLLVVMPIAGAVLITKLGGRVALVTGKSVWLGYTLTIPPVTFYGLIALTLMARKLELRTPLR